MSENFPQSNQEQEPVFQGPDPNSLMDGKDHGAFVAPLAPVESEHEAHYSFDQVPNTEQPAWEVEDFAKKRMGPDVTQKEIYNNLPQLTPDLDRINGARQRGIHLSH